MSLNYLADEGEHGFERKSFLKGSSRDMCKIVQDGSETLSEHSFQEFELKVSIDL